jgi:uncharacterized protein (DUF2384 family)
MPEEPSVSKAAETRVDRCVAELEQGDAEVRRRAAQALGEHSLQALTAIPALYDALRDDPSDSVRNAAYLALARILGRLVDSAYPAEEALQALALSSDEAEVGERAHSPITELAQMIKNPRKGADIPHTGFSALPADSSRPHLSTKSPQSPSTRHSAGDSMDRSLPHEARDSFTIEEAASELGVPTEAIRDWLSKSRLRSRAERDATGSENSGLTGEEMRALRAHRVEIDAFSLFREPDAWLDTPNPWLGDESPRQLIGTDREELVLDILEGIKHGVVA